MTNETKQRIIKLAYKDKTNAYDNLRQTQIAFAGSDLSELWSGQTKQSIIDGYQRRYDEARATLAELHAEGQPMPSTFDGRNRIMGALAGTYRVILAAGDGKRLFADVRVDEDNGHSTWFILELGSRMIETQNLQSAMRQYDAYQLKEVAADGQ